MKKLVVPILIGVLMFAAAFGGAFYYYRFKDERAAAAIRTLAEEVLGDLQRTGHTPAMTARLLVVVPATPAAAPARADSADGTAGTPALLAVPATVRYDLDLRDAQAKDIVWDAGKRRLRVKVPALTLSEPQIDSGGIRALSGAQWMPVRTALDSDTRKAALGQLLSQAREDGPLGFARDTARKTVERAFAAELREAGEKASVEIRFADEKSVDHGGGRPAAAAREE